MIEKNLGEGETMVVQRSSIIGFSQSVQMKECKTNGFAKKEFIVLEGPGILIIETGPEEEGILARTFSKREATR